jgi:branched-chain amino acid transport system ATP-binding protein
MLLEVRHLTVTFARVNAVKDVRLDVAAGQVVGIIGPNGAGKTTLIDAICGFVRSSGTITLQGAGRVDGKPAHRRARAGIARTWQSVELFDGLSVLDNVLIPRERVTPGNFAASLLLPHRHQRPAEAAAFLDMFGLGPLAARSAAELTPGQAQLVGLARAMASDAKIIFMDEPSAGLDSHETRPLAGHIRALANRGTAVVLVEHDMDLLFAVSDVIHVMTRGEMLASGTVNEVRANPAVVEAYLGRSLASPAPIPERRGDSGA